MHVVISVKDFKAIVTHAETLRGSLSAQFSRPSRPLQFSYDSHGIHCEFTLMTTGDHRGAPPASQARAVTSRAASKQPSSAAPPSASTRTTNMPPPTRPPPPSSQLQRRPLGALNGGASASAPAETDPDSLFVPLGIDDERRWDPPDYENEAEDMLGWDASGEMVCL